MGITSNLEWFKAKQPTDLIPDTTDPQGRGERFVQLCGEFTLTQGEHAGKRLREVMLPWQEKLIRKIWGDTSPDGTRTISDVGLKIGKGSGKTTLMAAFCIASIIDWEVRGVNIGNQIVLVAANIASADLAFRHIREGIAFDQFLRKNFHPNLSKREMTYKPTGVTIRVIAPDLHNAIGLRPALVLADELHQAAVTSKDFSAVIDQLRKGGQNTQEFLFVGVTTAAVARPEGYYREWLNRLRAIRDGKQVNESTLPILFEFPNTNLRPDLDISMKDEWWRAMPSMRTKSNLLGTMDESALEKELQEALDDADINGSGAMELLLSQRLGLEVEERGGGSGRTHLAQYWGDNICALPKPSEHLVVGLDPSSGLDDPFAVVSVWEDEDCYYTFSRQFLLRITFENSHKSIKSIYQKAIDQGELSLHESPSMMEDAVRAYCMDLMTRTPSANFCGDAAGLAGFKERFEETIATYKPIPQGWQLNAPLDRAGGLAYEKRLRHSGQPLLSANVANLIQENGRMRKFDAGSNGVGSAKIDGCMAMLSAILEISTTRRFDAAAICG